MKPNQVVEARIVADDGQFLGIISRNSVSSDSISNTVGSYGSTVSSTSIFNSVGNYGISVSSLSPFNSVSSSPPKIVDSNGNFIAYLTKNTIKTPRVDPDDLKDFLGR